MEHSKRVRKRKQTFFGSTYSAESLTCPLAIPGEYFSCFWAGTDIGDNGPLVSSTECFSDSCELFCLVTTQHKIRIQNYKFQNESGQWSPVKMGTKAQIIIILEINFKSYN